MEELFPGFYNRTEEELSMLWREATLVLDTNMLLNVYRYREETRERFFEILEQLKERIWTPYQVIYEYQNNRLEVISEQLKVYSEVSKVPKSARTSLEGLEHLREKHRFIKIDEIIENPISALAEANRKLSAGQQKHRQEYEELKTSDSYRDRIMHLFQSRIGDPYKKYQLLDIYLQADKRFGMQIPPGWKDKGKKTYDKYGDVILWFQLLEYAHAHKKPIIFITDDVKSDWFLSSQEGHGKPLPRPELVQEMHVEAGVLLHVYQGYEFLDQATKFLSLKPEPSISEDAKKVSEINSANTSHYVELLSKTLVFEKVTTQVCSYWTCQRRENQLKYSYDQR
jgi:predicted nucleic acid-binding protein